MEVDHDRHRTPYRGIPSANTWSDIVARARIPATLTPTAFKHYLSLPRKSSGRSLQR